MTKFAREILTLVALTCCLLVLGRSVSAQHLVGKRGFAPRRLDPAVGKAVEASRDEEFPRTNRIEMVTSPARRYLLTRGHADWIAVDDTQTGENLLFPHDRRAAIRPGSFSTDESRIVTVTKGHVSVWDLSTGVRECHYGRGVVDAAFLPNERTLAILRPGHLCFQSAETGEVTYGRITAGRRGRFMQLVLRFSDSGETTVFARTTDSRTGVYDLNGTLLMAGQRIPERGASTRLTLRD